MKRKVLSILGIILICGNLGVAGTNNVTAGVQWDVRTTAVAGNLAGGGFDDASKGATGVDHSQSDTAWATCNGNLSTAGAAAVLLTGTGDCFVDNTILGNVIHITTTATNFVVGYYVVVGYTDANNVTLNVSPTPAGAGANGIGYVGGSLLTLAGVATGYVAGNAVHIQAGTYTLTATLALTTAGTAALPVVFRGYGVTHNDRGTKPAITTATNSTALISLNAVNFITFDNLSLSNTAGTRAYGISAVTAGSTPVAIKNCVFDGFSTAIGASSYTFATISIVGTLIKNSTVNVGNFGAGTTLLVVLGSTFYLNTGSLTSGATFVVVAANSVFASNTAGVTSTGTGATATLAARNCVFDSNTDGIISAATTTPMKLVLENNIFWNNTTAGVSFAMNTNGYAMSNRNNAYGSNGTPRTNLSAGVGDVALAVSPFTSATDWSLNTAATGGALCRAAGTPGVLPYGGTGYADIGALQVAAGAAATTKAATWVQ